MAALRPTAVRAMNAHRGAFRPSAPTMSVKPVFQPHAGHFTRENFFKWVPSLALWGGAGGGAVMLFMSQVPIFQSDVLMKLPGLKAYYTDKTPDSDKPF
ncbi:hypothetical protein CBS101457_006518 [Exobasidium rhododendri]|nr:hypothetical protein CBS101457_006518 [Exobasidium rhododendri]